MKRKDKLECTVSKKEKALVVAAAEYSEKSMASFIRDAVIAAASKEME